MSSTSTEQPRELRLQEAINVAIRRGRRTVVASAVGAVFLSTAFGYLTLMILGAPSTAPVETVTLIQQQLTGEGTNGTRTPEIDPDARIYSFLAVFAAIAIATAVALEATGRRFRALDESRPTKPPYSQHEFNVLAAWAEASAAFRVLTSIELFFLCTLAGFSGIVTWALAARHDGRLPSFVAGLLTMLLLLEAIRGMHVWLAANDLKIVPDAAQLQLRVDRLMRRSRSRWVRRNAGRLLLITALGILGMQTFSTYGPTSTAVNLFVSTTIFTALGWLTGRRVAAEAVLEWGANRAVTVTMASVVSFLLSLMGGLFVVVQLTNTLSAVPEASESPLWWSLGGTALLGAATVYRVLDGAGVHPRSSSALAWLDHPPRSAPAGFQWHRSLTCVLLLGLTGGVILARDPATMGGAIGFSTAVVLMSAFARSTRGMAALLWFIATAISITIMIGHVFVMKGPEWTAIASIHFVLLYLAVLPLSRTYLSASLDVLVPLSRWRHQRRIQAWKKRRERALPSESLALSEPPPDGSAVSVTRE